MDKLHKPVFDANEALGKKLCAALIANGYKTAEYAATAEEAAALATALIPDGVTVGIPGTVTARELGLVDKLADKKCTIYQHWDPNLKPEDRSKRLLEENLSDWFVTSSNAITLDGKMINIDGTGNRVAGMAWAPGKLLYIVSLNKVARDIESGIQRSRDVATPPNAIRVGGAPPCTKIGYCVDCNSPDRTCRVVTIMERAPFGRECHAIIVGEHLGY